MFGSILHQLALWSPFMSSTLHSIIIALLQIGKCTIYVSSRPCVIWCVT